MCVRGLGILSGCREKDARNSYCVEGNPCVRGVLQSREANCF